MTLVLAICVAVVFGVSIYMMLGRELKGVAMGVFLLAHAAHLCILAQSGSPVLPNGEGLKSPPVLYGGEYEVRQEGANALELMVDPLPQALILTAIVISFAVMGFLLTLIIMTSRQAETLDINELGKEQLPTPSQAH